MDRYQRVEKPRPESKINENEIRITTQGLIRNYITYATSLLQEKRVKEIVLKAMGQAISKTVAVTEIIKKRVTGLQQDTVISSTSITDLWEPIEEGLIPLEMTRQVSMISITLSMKELNKESPGYQAPLHVQQPKTQYQYQQQQYQPKQPVAPTYGTNEVTDSYGWNHGRGPGRGRGPRGRGRGWGRGGFGNNQGRGGFMNNQGGGGFVSHQGNGGYGYNQENGGYRDWGQERGGRGRGWGSRGGGYERGRGGRGLRGYGRGRGRMGGRGRSAYGEQS